MSQTGSVTFCRPVPHSTFLSRPGFRACSRSCRGTRPGREKPFAGPDERRRSTPRESDGPSLRGSGPVVEHLHEAIEAGMARPNHLARLIGIENFPQSRLEPVQQTLGHLRQQLADVAGGGRQEDQPQPARLAAHRDLMRTRIGEGIAHQIQVDDQRRLLVRRAACRDASFWEKERRTLRHRARSQNATATTSAASTGHQPPSSRNSCTTGGRYCVYGALAVLIGSM